MSIIVRDIDDFSDHFSSLLHKSKDFLRSKTSFNVSLCKRELLLCLQQELKYGTAAVGGASGSYNAAMLSNRNYPSTSSSAAATMSAGNIPLESPLDMPQQVVTATTTRSTPISQPSLKRKNSKAPNFPPIEETGENDVAGVQSPDDTLVRNKKEKSPDPLSTESPASTPTMRPTSLAFKPPSIDKTQKQELKKANVTGSPKIPRSRPSVSFSDKVSEHSPSRKIFPSLSSKLLKTSSPIIEKHAAPAKKIYTKPTTKRVSSRLRQHVQSGFEADEEDASLETPKTSVSFPVSPYVINEGGGNSVPPLKKSPLAGREVINLNLVKEALTIEAEVHNNDITLTSESDNSDDTCLDSSDDDDRMISCDREPKPPSASATIQRVHTTDDTASSSIKRHMFKASRNVNVEFEEPDTDMVTGQVRRYTEPSPSPRSSPLPSGSSPSDTGTLNDQLTKDISTSNTAAAVTTKASKMYSASLNQAGGFLGQLQYPPDDDCSV